MSDPDSIEADEAQELVRARREYNRERRLVDQSISMQASLRDRDQFVAYCLTCTVLVASVVGVAFAFAGNDAPFELFGLEAERTTWLGWLAVVTFSVTLIDLVVDRRGAARQHRDAVTSLATLKAEYSAPIDSANELDHLVQLQERYRATMAAVPPVPERTFSRLKARHLRKVETSRLLSEVPGLSYWSAKRELERRVKLRKEKSR